MAVLLHRCQYHAWAPRFLKSFRIRHDVDSQLHMSPTEEVNGDRITIQMKHAHYNRKIDTSSVYCAMMPRRQQPFLPERALCDVQHVLHLSWILTGSTLLVLSVSSGDCTFQYAIVLTHWQSTVAKHIYSAIYVTCQGQQDSIRWPCANKVLTNRSIHGVISY
jgi:hypothetical protein